MEAMSRHGAGPGGMRGRGKRRMKVRGKRCSYALSCTRGGFVVGGKGIGGFCCGDCELCFRFKRQTMVSRPGEVVDGRGVL
jgi:hypothetical protein